MSTVSFIGVLVIAVIGLITMYAKGYHDGVFDTECRWSDAVKRKEGIS